MKSVMNHQFSQIPKVQIPRSVFDRTHGYKTTFNAGKLIPFFCDEVLPGDTFKLDASIFARLATPAVPIMDNMFLDVHYFFIPNRLVWENWEHFNGAKDNPDDDTEYVVPTVTAPAGGFTEGSIYDYMGIPTGVEGLEVNSLHMRAYSLTFNEWYKDQNLQDNIVVPIDDGPDSPSDFGLLRRNKKHDYFTSCLPWPQKGDPVTVSLGDTAPVIGNGTTLGLIDSYPSGTVYGLFKDAGDSALDADTDLAGEDVGHILSSTATIPSGKGVGLTEDPDQSGLIADLSESAGITINSLRESFQIQRMLEKDARGGTRYVEILRNHFGVISPDARLQRPEYLSGSSAKINISPVPQTGPSADSGGDAGTPQGNLAGFGIVADQGRGFTKSFVEHGVILGLVSVRCDLTYSQGLNRMWSRQERYDFYWPSFAHLGEQAVLSKEIYADGSAGDDDVFGYQERYAEYRYKPSLITGALRSSASEPLDIWHLSEDFQTRPTLNTAFINDTSDTQINRCIAVTDEPQFIFDSYIQLHCARPMPVYSVPGLIDHF